MAHRLAAVIVLLAALGVAACAPPSPAPAYVPCAIERPALGGSRLPTHLVGLPDTVDELFFPWPVGAGERPPLPPSDTAVRVRIELDESGGSRNLCLLDPLEPRIARALIDRARRGWLRVSPAVPRGRPGGPWIEDRVVWLRRAKPLETVLVEHPPSGAGVRDLEALALADRARFVELGRIGSADSLAAYDRMAARLEGAAPAPARLDALDPLDHPSWLPETRWSAPVPVSNAGGMAFRLTRGAMGRLYLARSLTPVARGSWSRPVPVDILESCCAELSSLELRDGAISLTCRSCADRGHKTQTTIRPADVFRDADGDRWTDIEERLLGLDPERADTDRDGLPDGADVCPTLPVSAAVRDDDEPIVQAAFLASFGTSWPSLPLFPSASMPRVHFRGCAGPVLYGVSPGEYVSQRGTYLEWEVVNRRENSAVVLFGASAKDTGSRFKLTVYLQRHKAKWYAVAVDGLSWHVDGV
jgi:hypothetical protein